MATRKNKYPLPSFLGYCSLASGAETSPPRKKKSVMPLEGLSAEMLRGIRFDFEPWWRSATIQATIRPEASCLLFPLKQTHNSN